MLRDHQLQLVTGSVDVSLGHSSFILWCLEIFKAHGGGNGCAANQVTEEGVVNCNCRFQHSGQCLVKKNIQQALVDEVPSLNSVINIYQNLKIYTLAIHNSISSEKIVFTWKEGKEKEGQYRALGLTSHLISLGVNHFTRHSDGMLSVP